MIQPAKETVFSFKIADTFSGNKGVSYDLLMSKSVWRLFIYHGALIKSRRCALWNLKGEKEC